MGGSIDWFLFAVTVPLVPMVAIIGALFWLRTARTKPDDAIDDPPGIYLAAQPEQSGVDIDPSEQR